MIQLCLSNFALAINVCLVALCTTFVILGKPSFDQAGLEQGATKLAAEITKTNVNVDVFVRISDFH